MVRPLRIVRALPFFAVQHGGPVAQARATSRELAARGHDVRIVTTDLGGLPSGAETIDGYSVLRVPARGFSRVPPYRPPRAARAALAALAQDADLLLGNVGLSLWNAHLARLAAARGLPFVYNAEGALDPLRLRHKRFRKYFFLHCCERAVLRRAAALQAVTTIERDHLLAAGAEPKRVHVIPNGVDLPARLPDRDRARGDLGLPGGAEVMLFLGRLHPLKGLDLALRAAAPLLQQDPRRLFCIVGPDDGGLVTARRLAGELGIGAQVRFEPAVADLARQQWFAAADLFALTSRSEGLPNSALEAAAAGLPLWLSSRCHLPEVAAARAGAVAPPEVEALRAALLPLLADRVLRARCGENARRMVATHFALPVVVDRLERLYLEVAGAAAAR